MVLSLLKFTPISNHSRRGLARTGQGWLKIRPLHALRIDKIGFSFEGLQAARERSTTPNEFQRRPTATYEPLREAVLISNRHDDDRTEREGPGLSVSPLSDLQLNSDRNWHPFSHAIHGAKRRPIVRATVQPGEGSLGCAAGPQLNKGASIYDVRTEGGTFRHSKQP